LAPDVLISVCAAILRHDSNSQLPSHMSSLIITVLASQVRVPDAGPTGLMLGIAVLSLGLGARLYKNRKKK